MYLPRNSRTEESVQNLRKMILEKTGCATTLGFGPRFLHSTGQLHKGGDNNGVYIEITRDSPIDLKIPEEGITFKILELAQATGDYEALQAKGRRVFRLHLHSASLASLSDWN
jgi:transaldolase/glucose-6-phosphate isomerase